MFNPDDYRAALDVAHERALAWLDSVPERKVRPQADIETQTSAFGGALQASPLAPEDVVAELATKAEPGLMAIGSGRFYGWVMGGTLPAALGADWLVSAWDQNSAMRLATPSMAAIEATAGRWLLDLLGLPAGSDVGFTTGATMANFMGVMAGRQSRARGRWLGRQCPWPHRRSPITVLAGGEVHASMMLAFRYAGLGLPQLVEADEQERMRPDALRATLADVTGPVILALQAGELHSGACDPFDELIPIAKEHGAWVHVDGAFGLWAAASPRFADATSWPRGCRFLGGPTPTRPSTCPTTAASRSCAVSWCGRRCASRPATSCTTTPAPPTRTRWCRTSPAVVAGCRPGRRCAHSGEMGVVALVEGLVDVAQELASRLACARGCRGAQRRGVHPGLPSPSAATSAPRR